MGRTKKKQFNKGQEKYISKVNGKTIKHNYAEIQKKNMF